MTLLESNVLNYRFLGCDTRARSEAEGERWRRRQCRRTGGGEERRKKEAECRRTGKRSGTKTLLCHLGLGKSLILNGPHFTRLPTRTWLFFSSMFRAVCVKKGACVKDVCKFCFRWDCGERKEEKDDLEALESAVKRERKRKKKKRNKHRKGSKIKKRSRKRRRHGRRRRKFDRSLRRQDRRSLQKRIIRKLRQAWTELNLLDG